MTEIKFLTKRNKLGHESVRPIMANIDLIFMQHPDFQDSFRYNSFDGVYETLLHRNTAYHGLWKGIEDEDIAYIASEIQKNYHHFDGGMKDVIKTSILNACISNQVSPPLEYLKKLEWDGVGRVDTWLSELFNVEDNVYNRYIGREWLKGLVTRIKKPGYKFDSVLILESQEQGIGKSRTMRELVNWDNKSYFMESTDNPDNGKNFTETLRGNVVFEFAEGSIMNYKHMDKLKSFVTETEDKYRPPYAKNMVSFKRQNVFIMTTNGTEYLKDSTGERRFWPMGIKGRINYEWIVENKDQLLAEAFTMTEDGYVEMDKDPEVYRIWQNMITERKVYDGVEEVITEWYEDLSTKSKETGVSFTETRKVAEESDSVKLVFDKNISNILINVLKLKKIRKQVEINGKKKRKDLYIPTENTKPEYLEDGSEQTELSALIDFDEF